MATASDSPLFVVDDDVAAFVDAVPAAAAVPPLAAFDPPRTDAVPAVAAADDDDGDGNGAGATVAPPRTLIDVVPCVGDAKFVVATPVGDNTDVAVAVGVGTSGNGSVDDGNEGMDAMDAGAGRNDAAVTTAGDAVRSMTRADGNKDDSLRPIINAVNGGTTRPVPLIAPPIPGLAVEPVVYVERPSLFSLLPFNNGNEIDGRCCRVDAGCDVYNGVRLPVVICPAFMVA